MGDFPFLFLRNGGAARAAASRPTRPLSARLLQTPNLATSGRRLEGLGNSRDLTDEQVEPCFHSLLPPRGHLAFADGEVLRAVFFRHPPGARKGV